MVFSPDCNQSLAVWTARTFFHLPYQHAQMQATARGRRLTTSASVGELPSSHATTTKSISKPIWQSRARSSLFVAERYLLFAQTPAGIRRGQVNHVPYPLAEATVDSWTPHR